MASQLKKIIQNEEWQLCNLPDSCSTAEPSHHNTQYELCTLCDSSDPSIVAATFIGLPGNGESEWLFAVCVCHGSCCAPCTQLWDPFQAMQELCASSRPASTPRLPSLLHYSTPPMQLPSQKRLWLQLIPVIFHMLISWIKYNFLSHSVCLCDWFLRGSKRLPIKSDQSSPRRSLTPVPDCM